jgi:hypothetical protein
MAVYVTGMLMPLSMFDVCEWQMLQKFLLSLSLSLYFFFFFFTFWVLDNVLKVVAISVCCRK